MATSADQEEVPTTPAAVMSDDRRPAVLIVGGLGKISPAVSMIGHKITQKGTSVD